ncbi:MULTISPECIES: pectinesterase family protein [Streptomyces]|uniref:pectinesterase family protein n=1 Tax=Streptomyces TaxID=1883 RepID=UPI000AD3F2F5|nr:MULTISPECIES: pectinesterase family protein [Streptomyces]
MASDGTDTYRTVRAAVDAVPADSTARRVITIEPGTYREIATIASNDSRITLRGLGSAAVFAHGHDFPATDPTISDDFGGSSVTSGRQAAVIRPQRRPRGVQQCAAAGRPGHLPGRRLHPRPHDRLVRGGHRRLRGRAARGRCR